MLQVLIDHKDGNVWDVTDLISDMSWKTSRIGKSSSLELRLIRGGLYQDRSFTCDCGDIIRVKDGDRGIFYGYIFTIESGQDEEVKLTAYDQTRYLLTNDTYVFQDITASQIVQRIADDFHLKVGELEDTGYKIPSMVMDNKKLFDIICNALDRTLIATGQNYVFFDDFGQLTVKNTYNMGLLDFVIGDKSLLYDYSHQRSIDNETYNRVKIVQNNKASGRRDVFITQDSDTIARWGLLQWYEVVDEGWNEAQINEKMANLLKLKNREQHAMTLEAMGDFRVRAGCFIRLLLQDLEINQPYLVDECTHQVQGAVHTMKLTLKVIG